MLRLRDPARSRAPVRAMRRSLDALDLASDAETQLGAAEVTLLMRQARATRRAEQSAPRLPVDQELRTSLLTSLRTASRPAVAEAWRNCLGSDPAFRTEAAREARLLLTLPAGGWTNWLEPHATPRCRLESIALAVLGFHLARLAAGDADWLRDVMGDMNRLPSRSGTPLGAEWWVQVRDVDEGMGVHWDCDEVSSSRSR